MREPRYVIVWEGGAQKYEHIAIMERHIGRPLGKNETVHHINGNKTDNRIKNLFLCSREQHDKAHGMKTVSLYRLHPHWVSKKCVRCGKNFYGSPKTMRDRKRCSVSCKSIRVDKTCGSCGTIYTIPVQHTGQWNYCSRKCRRKGSSDRDQ